jgi:hypothetical protein
MDDGLMGILPQHNHKQLKVNRVKGQQKIKNGIRQSLFGFRQYFR